jgi:antitoxin (DNA-binding transcriptional repressor) of toxin-antitoxin stability system
MPPRKIDTGEAEANLSRIIERAERGEEIILSRAGIPVAKTVALERRILTAPVGGGVPLNVLNDDQML